MPLYDLNKQTRPSAGDSLSIIVIIVILNAWHQVSLRLRVRVGKKI